MARKTTEDFINDALKIHGTKYDYSKVEYITAKDKIVIICREHGEFIQQPRAHIDGQGCSKCSKTTRKHNKLSIDDFISRAIATHGNRYDYSKAIYNGMGKKLMIICKEHGEFEQRADIHIKGQGCSLCVKSMSLTIDEFIKNAIIVHGDRYDYSKSIYKSAHKKLIIICKEHGEFEQTPNSHVSHKHGCTKCAIDKSIINLRISNDYFINKANIIHNNLYTYNNVNFVDTKTKVNITCTKHGDFSQTPNDHMNGYGCPTCGKSLVISSGHQEILDHLKSLGYNPISNDRKLINPYELDIVVDNLAIEYHGLYWHSYNRLETQAEINKHKKKHKLCVDKNVKLLQFFENEWLHKRDIVKSIINHHLNKSNKLQARKCEISEITNSEAIKFCNDNHIQGGRHSRINIGLKYNDHLVSIITINSHSEYQYEIIRFCSKLNISVAGGYSKLLNYFNKKYTPKSIMTYVDKRLSNGNNYPNFGFTLSSETKPNYKYINHDAILSRQKCQKHKLKDLLSNFDDNLPESENMFNNGYRRLWDAGHYKFIKYF